MTRPTIQEIIARLRELGDGNMADRIEMYGIATTPAAAQIA